MKKIGIITFHRAHNYGAMLQAYALQETLNKYEVKIIDYNDENINKHYKIIKIEGINIVSKIKQILTDIFFLRKNICRYKSFDRFMKIRLNLTKEYCTKQDLIENYPIFNIYITGSDQVWNPNIVGDIDDIYTLSFGGKNIKKISYAASIGVSKLNEYTRNKLIDKLNNLNYISVREESAKKIISTSNLNKKIEVVLDPTFLLSKEQWINKISCKNDVKEEYILAYEVDYDEEYIKVVNYLSKLTNLKVIYFEKRNKGYKNVLKNEYCSGPENFIKFIYNAKYVVTSSFHATAFSLIFNKKFWVFTHKTTGSRTTDLLNSLGLQDRYINSLNDFKIKDYDCDINYIKVNKIINEMKNKSIEWLINSIEN